MYTHVLSNHWEAKVLAKLGGSPRSARARAVIRSHLMGFLLYAMAELPYNLVLERQSRDPTTRTGVLLTI